MKQEVTEQRRLAVLRDLAILDTPPEPAYDDIAQLAATACRSPIAAVNFVDAERHWTKAIVGAEGGQGSSVPADVSFCAATVATDGGVLTLPDTAASPHWESHPLVSGHPFVGFYAGATISVSGQPVGVVCVFGDEPREISDQEQEALAALARQASTHLELRRHNAGLRDLALTDALTGLANRTRLFDHLELAVAQRQGDGRQVGVLFCDVDGFKQVNDRWGHEAGDRVLRRLADRLRSAARDGDTVGRLAGDEFVVICPGLDAPEDLDAVVSRVDRAIHKPDPADEQPPAPRVSIGAALLEEGETALSVLHRADAAMYERKSLGSLAPLPG